MLARPVLEERIEQVGVLRAREHVLEHLGLRPRRVAHCAPQPVPLTRLERHHPDVAVLAGQNRGGRAEAHPDAAPSLPLPVLRERPHVLGAREQRRNRLGARDVEIPATGLLSAHDRAEPPRRRDVAAEEVRAGRPVLERWLARPAAVAVTRCREVVRVQVVRLPVRVRARAAERRNRDPDPAGVRGEKRMRIESPRRKPRRRRVLHDRVGRCEKRPECRAISLRTGVEFDALLVRVEEEEEPTLLRVWIVAWKRAEPARGVAARPLDLDHFGAVVGEKPRAKGRGHLLSEFDHADSREGSVRHGIRLCDATRMRPGYNNTDRFVIELESPRRPRPSGAPPTRTTRTDRP